MKDYKIQVLRWLLTLITTNEKTTRHLNFSFFTLRSSLKQVQRWR